MAKKLTDHPAAKRLPRWPSGHSDDCLCELCEAALYRRMAWWANRVHRYCREGKQGFFDATLARAVLENTWEQLRLFDVDWENCKGDGYADDAKVPPS